MKFGLREAVFILLLMAIPTGTWWLVFRPRNARNVEITQQIGAKQIKLSGLNRTIGEIGSLQTEIASLEKGISDLQAKLPSEKEIGKVLEEVWKLAEANHLTSKGFNKLDKGDPTFTAPNSPHAEEIVLMKLEGDYRGFYSFLLAMENQPRIMRIRKMTLARPDATAEGFVAATIEMTIFYEVDRLTKEKI